MKTSEYFIPAISRVVSVVEDAQGIQSATIREAPDGGSSAAASGPFSEFPVRALVSVPSYLGGTELQRAVWTAICTIPAGETASYAELARRVGRPKAVRAVASACGRNVLALLVPCHRVIASDGSLGGYRWGVEVKAALLRAEVRRSQDACADVHDGVVGGEALVAVEYRIEEHVEHDRDLAYSRGHACEAAA